MVPSVCPVIWHPRMWLLLHPVRAMGKTSQERLRLWLQPWHNRAMPWCSNMRRLYNANMPLLSSNRWWCSRWRLRGWRLRLLRGSIWRPSVSWRKTWLVLLCTILTPNLHPMNGAWRISWNISQLSLMGRQVLTWQTNGWKTWSASSMLRGAQMRADLLSLSICSQERLSTGGPAWCWSWRKNMSRLIGGI